MPNKEPVGIKQIKLHVLHQICGELRKQTLGVDVDDDEAKNFGFIKKDGCADTICGPVGIVQVTEFSIEVDVRDADLARLELNRIDKIVAAGLLLQ